PGGAGWYLLKSDGTLTAWDHSNNPTGTVVATGLDPSVFLAPSLLYAATPHPLYDLKMAYGLTTSDLPGFFNRYRGQERWLQSSNGSNPAGSGYYLILPNNTLVAWDGTTNATGTVVAHLDPRVYNTPALLYDANLLPFATAEADNPLYDLRQQYGLVTPVQFV